MREAREEARDLDYARGARLVGERGHPRDLAARAMDRAPVRRVAHDGRSAIVEEAALGESPARVAGRAALRGDVGIETLDAGRERQPVALLELAARGLDHVLVRHHGADRA